MNYEYRGIPKDRDRLTIGFLDENMEDDFDKQMLMGVLEAAKKNDVNIIRFGRFSPFVEFDMVPQTQIVLDHIGQYDIDGLIFIGWSQIGPLFNPAFTSSFGSIPLLSIGTGYGDIPCVFFAGDVYIRELLEHLIHIHGYKKIAYISPITPDSRSDMYIKVMQENGIYHPDLFLSHEVMKNVSIENRGMQALSILLDERQVEVDAILTIYYNEVEDIMNGLKQRGIDIPKDVAVACYEAGEYGKFSSPAMTTIEFPWMALGYKSCEKMAELLRKGKIPLRTEVPSRIIFRESCGCLPNSILMAAANEPDEGGKTLADITIEEKIKILCEMEKVFRYASINFEHLLEAFIQAYRTKSSQIFMDELEKQLQKIPSWENYMDTENIISVFRRLLMPYLIHEADALLWSGDTFQQSQVLIRERVACIDISEKVEEKNADQTMHEIGRIIVTKFNRQELARSLEENLPKLNIRSCFLLLFQQGKEKENLFNCCKLELAFEENTGRQLDQNRLVTAKEHLAGLLSDTGQPFSKFAYLLHVSDEFLGMILFEPGPKGERIYQFLTACISTAVSGSILVDKLDSMYKKLIEQAQREGMAEIAINILHNIGNILNSVNASAVMMLDMANAALFEDLKQAHALLEKNLDSLDEFITKDVKAKKLMQFYIRLGMPFSEIQQQLMYHADRLSDKVNFINEIIISQQNYAGVNTTLEELNIAAVLDDVIKLHSASIEKYHIMVQREFRAAPRVQFQRIKMFHILVNLMNNSIEAMAGVPVYHRILKFILDENEKGKYIHIQDSGCGIPENLRDRIFTEGFTTKKGRQGIGLKSCVTYLNEMGGEILVQSEGEGKGAIFTLKFM